MVYACLSNACLHKSSASAPAAGYGCSVDAVCVGISHSQAINQAHELSCKQKKKIDKLLHNMHCCRERILHITHVLADVYEETPNPEERIKTHHRQRARQFMAAVEANDVERCAGLVAAGKTRD
jgi:hypothetical protein